MDQVHLIKPGAIFDGHHLENDWEIVGSASKYTSVSQPVSEWLLTATLELRFELRQRKEDYLGEYNQTSAAV